MLKIKASEFRTPRRADWLLRWAEFIKDSLDLKKDLALDWSYTTCTSWSGDGIEAITGSNPFDPWRDQFSTMLGAAKVIRQSGFNTLDDLIAYMFQEIPLGMAQSGDLVLTPSLVSVSRWRADIEKDGPENTDTNTKGNTSGDTIEPDLVMPSGVALADPPVFWAVTEKGLGKGKLYTEHNRAFAVGRSI